MRAPADDEPVPGFGVPDEDGDDAGDGRPGGRRRSEAFVDDGAIERDRWAMRASAHPGRRPRRRAATLAFDPADHQDPDRRRYFLSSLQPSGDYEAVIVAITDGASRRYFSSRDGSHFIEVDELSFEQRRKSGSRSMLEIGEHELRELEDALIFVRPLDGRDPIAEVAAARKASLEATRPMAIVPVAAPEAASADAKTDVAVDTTTDVAADAKTDVAADATRRPDADEASADDSTLVWADDASAADEDDPEAEAPGPRRATFEPIPPGGPAEPTPNAEADASAEPRLDPDGEPEPEAAMPPVLEPEPELEPDGASATAPPAPPAPHAPAASPAPPAPPASAASPAPAALSPLDAVAQVALAKGIAFAAHRGQLDKSGTPYIDHPGRIAERFDPVTDPIAAAAAWLHDVLEDTPLTSRELFEAGVLIEIVGVVELLTRRPEVTPDEYYARIRRHPVALRVKLADIDDNTAPWRLRRLEFAKQQRLAEKYRHARRALGVE
ncbi:hypothetical protein [Agromyces sp. GXQ0307]|uniref:hypothetical protein n=1 Tax=Agromyces sp. GXQ0307 TaxID=3377835 RepID=UPI00383B8774